MKKKKECVFVSIIFWVIIIIMWLKRSDSHFLRISCAHSAISVIHILTDFEFFFLGGKFGKKKKKKQLRFTGWQMRKEGGTYNKSVSQELRDTCLRAVVLLDRKGLNDEGLGQLHREVLEEVHFFLGGC